MTRSIPGWMTMLGAGIAFLGGVCTALLSPSLPAVAVGALFVLLGALASRGRRLRALLLCFAGAMMLVGAQGAMRLHGALPSFEQGRDRLVSGVITDVRRLDRLQRIEVLTDRPVASMPAGIRLRLNWYGAAPVLSIGDHWQLLVRLKRPHGLRNPSTFDYETWLFARDVRSLGYVRDSPRNRRKPGDRANLLLRLRASLADELRMGEYRQSGLLIALITGLRADVLPQQWQVLRNTGTAHLFSISGLHVGLAGWFGYLLGWIPWWLAAGRCARISRVCCQCGCALVAAATYAALAGFSVPTQRALIMLSAILIARLSARRVPPARGFGAALIVVLIVDPWAPLALGFWLSFFAVAVIFWQLAGRRDGYPRVIEFLRLQGGITLALAPILLAAAGQAPLLGAAANLIAVPLVSFLSVPAALAGVVAMPVSALAGNAMFALADFSLDGLWSLLRWCSEQPYAHVSTGAPRWWHFALAGLSAVLLCAPRAPVPRWAAATLLLPLLLPAWHRPDPGNFELTVLDTGQALAATVETHSRVLVFDTGISFAGGYSTGSAVVAPFLRNRGWTRIDRVVLSHADGDHAGGLPALAEEIHTADVYASDGSAAAGRDVKLCATGQRWRWDGVDFEFLHPPAHWSASSNDRSCVLRVAAGDRAVLLPGDLERHGEYRLLNYPARFNADVLVVPHHGSSTSTTRALLEAVKPRYAVISAGFRNRFGFPHAAVCERLRDAGAVVLITALEGAVSFTVSPAGVAGVRRYRRDARRFWHRLEPPGRCAG